MPHRKVKSVFCIAIVLGLSWITYYYFFSSFFTPSAQDFEKIFAQHLKQGDTVEQIKTEIDTINQKYRWKFIYSYVRTIKETESYAIMHEVGYFFLARESMIVELELDQQQKLKTIKAHPVGTFL